MLPAPESSKLPSLVQLLIEPKLAPRPALDVSNDIYANVYMAHGRLLRGLKDLHESSACPIEQLAHWKPSGVRDHEWEEVVRRDWLDRLRGGPGCWLASC